jgi:glucosyl-dolichyl phosphate glucuronosyltransferase
LYQKNIAPVISLKEDCCSPFISIILTSYTLERLNDIYELLTSISTQTFHDFETIFIVEGSKELYNALLSFSKNNGFKINLVFSDQKLGLSGARNLGGKIARGDILAFVDDDAALFPQWAEQVFNTFQDNSIVGVTGPAVPSWKNNALNWFPKEFYWLIGGTGWYEQKEISDVRNGWGMNMSFRRQAFVECDGFNTNFGLRNCSRSNWSDPPSEDVDLSLRVKKATGKRIVFNPKVQVFHRVNETKVNTLFIMQRAFSVGYQRRAIKKLYGEDFKKQDMFTLERGLISSILLKLFPSIALGFFNTPNIAFKKATVTCLVLMFVGLGYFQTFKVPK